MLDFVRYVGAAHTRRSWGSPKDTAIAASTCCMMSSSTRPIFSRRRFLSKVRICSSRMMESRGRPLLCPGNSICVGSLALPVREVMAAAMTVGL